MSKLRLMLYPTVIILLISSLADKTTVPRSSFSGLTTTQSLPSHRPRRQRLQAEEVITCAKLLLDEYERICPAYCQKAGIDYPTHKVEIIKRLIVEFEQLV